MLRMNTRSFPLILSVLLLAACGSGDDVSGSPPAAPSRLTAEPLAGGAHLTWTDNADNETEYMVMRMVDGVDTEYRVVATLPFDAGQYHDAPLTSRITYMYMVMAMNDDGQTASNEVTFAAP